jgi:septum formation protein
MPSMTLYLASASPRRKQLLTAIGLDVVVCPVNCDEKRLDGESPRALALRLAREKAMLAQVPEEALVLAADTIVALGHAVFGKPGDKAEAKKTLHALSGKTHEVITGFCVKQGSYVHTEAVDTQVTFRHLSEKEIGGYVETGEWTDKAGAYGIQESGGALVVRVDGSYSNVVGLPLPEVLKIVKRVERLKL